MPLLGDVMFKCGFGNPPLRTKKKKKKPKQSKKKNITKRENVEGKKKRDAIYSFYTRHVLFGGGSTQLQCHFSDCESRHIDKSERKKRKKGTIHNLRQEEGTSNRNAQLSGCNDL